MVQAVRTPPPLRERPLLLYHPDFLKYDFRSDHALREERVKLARDLIEDLGLLSVAEEREPAPATDGDVLAVHDPRYVRVLKRLSEWPGVSEPEFGLEPGDNPPFRGMYGASLLQAGATLLAADLIVERKATRAYNLGGGFHHAMPARASGFCILNDIAIGIHHLLESGIRRVLYVDIDGHHGDGVQAIFYRDPRVLTVSLHEDGRFLFPGSGSVDEIGEEEGRGYAVNVPVPPHTGDASWTKAFDGVVLPLAESYRPEVLFTQTGADAHTTDPLTHLDLTTEAYEHAGSRFDEIARRWCGDRWIAVGGGGYDVTTVPRVWTLLFGALVQRRPANALPDEWLRECRQVARREPRDGTLRDASSVAEEPPVSRGVDRVIEAVRTTILPIHGLR